MSRAALAVIEIGCMDGMPTQDGNTYTYTVSCPRWSRTPLAHLICCLGVSGRDEENSLELKQLTVPAAPTAGGVLRALCSIVTRSRVRRARGCRVYCVVVYEKGMMVEDSKVATSC